ncbi:DUF1405 domain-containing protein, partial [Scopulibacillus cellulosilyticus]
MTIIYYLLKQKWVITTLLIINILGTVYGFYWYKFQLKETPLKFMAFVPDSPTASLFFCIVLAGFLLKKHWPLFIKRKPYARRMVPESFQRCNKKSPSSDKINFGSPTRFILLGG